MKREPQKTQQQIERRKESYKRYREKNKEKRREQAKRWRLKNPDKCIKYLESRRVAYAKEETHWWEKNRIKVAASKKKYRSCNRDPDYYIRGLLLNGLKGKSRFVVFSELIELKRLQLLLKRAIKEIRK